MTHQEEIINSRVGGFGGSDATMFLKIGRKGIGSLSNTDKKRIAVAKGLINYTQILGNESMQRGHDFETWYEENHNLEGYTREALIIGNGITDKFKIFAHSDFYHQERQSVKELKCVKDIIKAQTTYKAQIQWYYLIGADTVELICCDNTYFDFESGLQEGIFIAPDADIIALLKKGIELMAENWDNLLQNETDINLIFEENQPTQTTKKQSTMKATEITMQIVKNLGNYETARLEATYILEGDEMENLDAAFEKAKIDLELAFKATQKEFLTKEHTRFNAVCDALKAKKATLESVKKVFLLTAEMTQILEKI